MGVNSHCICILKLQLYGRIKCAYCYHCCMLNDLNFELCMFSANCNLCYGKSSESVQCTITGPCLRMHHRPSA